MHGKADIGEGTASVPVRAIDEEHAVGRDDVVAVEEPMEIRVESGADGERRTRSVSVTMRTPGNDFELALGFLYSEGLIASAAIVRDVAFCGPPPPGKAQSNIVRVELDGDTRLDLVKLQRNFYSTSSCGICGKASLEALNFEGYSSLAGKGPRISPSLVHSLPQRLREAQETFDTTGGLHAAGLFDARGQLLVCREDVGRHNAVDKLIGAQLMAGELPLEDRILVVSGRTSFEIMQKALAAGVPIVVAVGAPSSLAVEMAERFDITLIGFARDQRFNVYSAPERIIEDDAAC